MVLRELKLKSLSLVFEYFWGHFWCFRFSVLHTAYQAHRPDFVSCCGCQMRAPLTAMLQQSAVSNLAADSVRSTDNAIFSHAASPPSAELNVLSPDCALHSSSPSER